MCTWLVAFLPLTEYSCLRHSSSIVTFFLTWLNIWANPWSNWVLSIHAEDPSALGIRVISWLLISWLLSKPLFYNFNCSKPNWSVSLFREAQPMRWIKQMVLRSSSCRAISVIPLGYSSCKSAISSRSCKSSVGSAFPTSWLDSKSDEFGTPEKGTPVLSHISTPVSSHISTPAPSPASVLALAESMLALKYSKVDLMKILKIFLESKSQEPKSKVSCKQPLKAKVSEVYFAKLHMDCYYFCQQYKDHFKTASATRSNRTLFAALFFCRKINFWWYQHQK